MKVNYKFYEKDVGFEEFQAKIYNANNPDNPQPVTAEDILKRFETEKIDPKTVRYVLNEHGEPFAYVQARDYPESKETHLGYPWALPDCPPEAQDKIFDEMLAYLKTRNTEFEIRVNVAANNAKQLEFVQTRPELEEKSRSYRRDLNVKAISEKSLEEGKYQIRKATKDDVDLLVNLMKEDGRFASQFTADQEIEKYFSERVLPDDHCYLVFQDEKLIRASAPLITKLPRDTEERLILRFHSFLPETDEAFRPLLIAIAKECVNSGLDTKPISLFESADDSKLIKSTIQGFNPIHSEVQGISFGLKE